MNDQPMFSHDGKQYPIESIHVPSATDKDEVLGRILVTFRDVFGNSDDGRGFLVALHVAAKKAVEEAWNQRGRADLVVLSAETIEPSGLVGDVSGPYVLVDDIVTAIRSLD